MFKRKTTEIRDACFYCFGKVPIYIAPATTRSRCSSWLLLPLLLGATGLLLGRLLVAPPLLLGATGLLLLVLHPAEAVLAHGVHLQRRVGHAFVHEVLVLRVPPVHMSFPPPG